MVDGLSWRPVDLGLEGLPGLQTSDSTPNLQSSCLVCPFVWHAFDEDADEGSAKLLILNPMGGSAHYRCKLCQLARIYKNRSDSTRMGPNPSAGQSARFRDELVERTARSVAQKLQMPVGQAVTCDEAAKASDHVGWPRWTWEHDHPY